MPPQPSPSQAPPATPTQATAALTTAIQQLIGSINAGIAAETQAMAALRTKANTMPGQSTAGSGGSGSLAAGMGQLQSAAMAVAGTMSGVLAGAMQAVQGAATATASAMSGSLTGAIGGVAIAAAGLTVGLVAAAAVAKSFATAAAPDGMQFFSDTLRIVTGIIGTAILPGFAMLAASLLMAGDSIQSYLTDHLDELVQWYVSQKSNFESFSTGLAKLTTSLMEGTSTVYGFFESLGRKVSQARDAITIGAATIAEKVLPESMGLKGLAKTVQEDAYANSQKQSGKGPAANPAVEAQAAAAGADGKKRDTFADKMNKVVGSMAQGFAAGKTGYGDIASQRESIQTQNLQTDLQRELLNVQKDALEVTRRVADGVEKQRPPIGK